MLIALGTAAININTRRGDLALTNVNSVPFSLPANKCALQSPRDMEILELRLSKHLTVDRVLNSRQRPPLAIPPPCGDERHGWSVRFNDRVNRRARYPSTNRRDGGQRGPYYQVRASRYVNRDQRKAIFREDPESRPRHY